jgi:hypothetical protein
VVAGPSFYCRVFGHDKVRVREDIRALGRVGVTFMGYDDNILYGTATTHVVKAFLLLAAGSWPANQSEPPATSFST